MRGLRARRTCVTVIRTDFRPLHSITELLAHRGFLKARLRDHRGSVPGLNEPPEVSVAVRDNPTKPEG